MRSEILILVVVATSGCAAKGTPASVSTSGTGAEKRVQVCVVDPIAPGGMMTLSAMHVEGTRDTTVLQANGRVPVARTLTGAKVWRSGPLLLTTGSGRTRFSPSGKPRAVEPGKITLLGMVGSVPIFAGPADAGPMRAEVEALAASGSDLEKSLRARVSLRRQMSKVRTLYMPTSLVNCVFQTFKR